MDRFSTDLIPYCRCGYSVFFCPLHYPLTMVCFLCYSIHGEPLCGGWFIGSYHLTTWVLFFYSFVLPIYCTSIFVREGNIPVPQRCCPVWTSALANLSVAGARYHFPCRRSSSPASAEGIAEQTGDFSSSIVYNGKEYMVSSRAICCFPLSCP